MSNWLLTLLNRVSRLRLTIAVSLVAIGSACFIEPERWRICYCVVAAIFVFAAWVRLFDSA
jgi:hypothetical protein